MRDLGFWRFYGRVLLRVPSVFVNAAALVGALILLAAAIALFLKGKALANDVLGLHGFSPAWAIVPCGLILVYGLAKANYEEAQLIPTPTNRTNPAPSPVTIQNVNIYLGGPNSARPPAVPPESQPPGTRTELEDQQ